MQTGNGNGNAIAFLSNTGGGCTKIINCVQDWINSSYDDTDTVVYEGISSIIPVDYTFDKNQINKTDFEQLSTVTIGSVVDNMSLTGYIYTKTDEVISNDPFLKYLSDVADKAYEDYITPNLGDNDYLTRSSLGSVTEANSLATDICTYLTQKLKSLNFCGNYQVQTSFSGSYVDHYNTYPLGLQYVFVSPYTSVGSVTVFSPSYNFVFACSNNDDISGNRYFYFRCLPGATMTDGVTRYWLQLS